MAKICASFTLTFGIIHGAAAPLVPDAPNDCPQCENWNRPQEPFRVFGNTYYVGTAELAAVLVVTDAGLVLLDGALTQSAPLIDAGIRKLGFATADIRYILNSHTHHDHAGGIAALQRASGALVAASASSAGALRGGHPVLGDPQFVEGKDGFPAVAEVRVIDDGETLMIGDARITAHFTPGHTPGGTTWTWQACEGGRCLHVVYADSLNAVSVDGFRFTGGAAAPAIVDQFRQSIQKVADLPCDILLTPHPGFFDMQGKLQRRAQGEPDAFIDPGACRAYASAAAARLDRRIAEENGSR